MDKHLFEKTINKYSQNSNERKEWYILFNENTITPKNHCICGHNVKRITYIYNKFTKQIMVAGTTCIKKFGIKQHLQNGILLLTIKNNIESNYFLKNSDNLIIIDDFSDILKHCIQTKFSEYKEKINICESSNTDVDYYDIVAPFRRLLNDVCDLVTEYKYDFTNLLKDIEKNVNQLNNVVKHIIIDESEPIYYIIENNQFIYFLFIFYLQFYS